MRARNVAAAVAATALAVLAAGVLGSAVPADAPDAPAIDRESSGRSRDARVASPRTSNPRAAPPEPPAAAPAERPEPRDLTARIPWLVPLEDLPLDELLRIASTRHWRLGRDDWRPPEADAAAAELERRGASIVPELFARATGEGGSAAREFLASGGVDAVPFLVGRARTGSDHERETALSILRSGAERSFDLGPHAGDVVEVAVAALGDGDRGELAEALLAHLPACVPDVVAVAASGDAARTAAALRVLQEIAYDDERGGAARAALEAVASDPERPAPVRAAAVQGLACVVYDELDAADVPRFAGARDVRLWALAFATDADDPDPAVVQALAEERAAATALFVEAALTQIDDDLAWDVVGALRAAEPDAAPLLLDVAARTTSTDVRAAALSALGDVVEQGSAGRHSVEIRDALLAALADPDDDVREVARASLHQAGTHGLDVAAGLAAALDGDASREAALAALYDLGPVAAAAAPALLRLALDESAPDEDRQAAFGAYASADRGAALAAATPLLDASSAHVRWAAARLALGDDLEKPHPTNAETRAIAIRLLADPDADVRLLGAQHLARAAERDGVAPPELLRVAGDPDVRVVRSVAGAIRAFDPATPGVCDVTLACLSSEDDDVRWWASRASDQVLAACGAPGVALLERMIASDDDEVAAAGVHGIRRVAGRAPAALPAVVGALFDRSGRLRGEVLEQLAYWENDDAADAVPVLVECFRRGMDASVDGRLLDTLDDLGWTPARADVEHVFAAIRWDEGDPQRASRAAFRLLERAGGAAAALVPRLLAAARASSGLLRERAIDCLGAAAPGDPDVVAFLVAALGSADVRWSCSGGWHVPAAAARALGRVGSAARDALPALRVAAADDDDSWLHRCAAEAISAIEAAMAGEAARAAEPAAGAR